MRDTSQIVELTRTATKAANPDKCCSLTYTSPMDEITFIAEADPDCGYRARAVGQSIFAQAATIDDLKAAVIDAVKCHFDEGDMPRHIRLQLPTLDLVPA